MEVELLLLRLWLNGLLKYFGLKSLRRFWGGVAHECISISAICCGHFGGRFSDVILSGDDISWRDCNSKKKIGLEQVLKLLKTVWILYFWF